ncbi:MAG: hypothetical protein ACRETY_09255 [Steroidobacteraceae bacterium]
MHLLLHRASRFGDGWFRPTRAGGWSGRGPDHRHLGEDGPNRLALLAALRSPQVSFAISSSAPMVTPDIQMIFLSANTSVKGAVIVWLCRRPYPDPRGKGQKCTLTRVF